MWIFIGFFSCIHTSAKQKFDVRNKTRINVGNNDDCCFCSSRAFSLITSQVVLNLCLVLVLTATWH